MYKISVPISIKSIRDTEIEKDLNKYLDYFKRGKIERVFVCCIEAVYSKNCELRTEFDKFKKVVEFFKYNDMEVGIWLGGFGHGVILAHESDNTVQGDYQVQVSVTGEAAGDAHCPLDKSFTDDYMEIVKKAASIDPDLIMIDDDFRLNRRFHQYMGCFCPKHLEEFYRLIGEEVPRNKIEEKVFTGGRNKYRDAYMEMSKKTLLDFARSFRAAVDEVNPNIRAGVCLSCPNWDLSGTDGIEIARAFAGKNKPFLRTCGAPYWDQYALIDVIEDSRMQMNWIRTYGGNDIEAFLEGDVYPRPRYNISSKSLELYDLALLCDGSADGNLKYMFDYDLSVGYEEGYIEKHIKNLDIQKKVKALFENKKLTGVTVFSAMHKVRDWKLPEKLKNEVVRTIEDASRSYANDILPMNGIPVCYEKSDYPMGVFGESARHIPLDMLSNGAILDSVSAAILKERGVDTGIIGLKPLENICGEYYIKDDNTIRNFDVPINELVCDDNADVLTVLLPNKTPGSYTYENKDGIRFLVFAGDFQFSKQSAFAGEFSKQIVNYYNNYCRQIQVKDAIEWIGKKKLPAVCMKNPNLYIMTAANEKAMSVLLMNIFMDEIDNPVITLDKEYKNIKFVNCSGELKGDTVYLSELLPYGFAAFEVE